MFLFGLQGSGFGQLGAATSGNLSGIILSYAGIAQGASNGATVGTASIVGSYTGSANWTFNGSANDPTGTFTINSTTGLITVLSNTDLATYGSFPITISVSGTTPSFTNLVGYIWVIATAPILALDPASDSSGGSNVTNVTSPVIDFTGTLYAGDIISFSFDAFATVYSSHTLTAGEIASGSVALGGMALTDGAKSLTAKISRGGYSSSASSAATFTIDTQIPVLSAISGTKTGSSTANLSITTTDYDANAGNIYWTCDTSSTPPSAAQVIAGQNHSGSSTGVISSNTAASSATVTPSATGLASSTTYYVYSAQRTVAVNTSLAYASVGTFTTDASAASAAYTNFVARTSGGNLGGNVTYQNAFAALLNGLTTDGLFNSDGTSTYLDALYIFVSPDSTTANLNLVSSSYGLTGATPPTFSAGNGYTGNGSQYLDTGFGSATAAGKWTLNSASQGVYIVTSRAAGAAYAEYGSSDTTNSTDLYPWYTDNKIYFESNNNSSGLTTSTNVNGMWVVSRTGSTQLDVYKGTNSTPLFSSNLLAVSLQTQTFWICGKNGAGSLVNGSQDQLGCIFFGAGLTSTLAVNLATRVGTFMAGFGH